ncbi:hypothetical protein NKH18_19700 [Streptomyces sp. M10(2022)]
MPSRRERRVRTHVSVQSDQVRIAGAVRGVVHAGQEQGHHVAQPETVGNVVGRAVGVDELTVCFLGTASGCGLGDLDELVDERRGQRDDLAEGG